MAHIAKKLLINSSELGKNGAKALMFVDSRDPVGSSMDALGIQLMHEHIFFSDGTNIGFGVGKSDTAGLWGSGCFFYYGQHDPEIRTFAVSEQGLNDDVLREACCLSRNFGEYAGLYHNCQHWVNRVKEAYADLMRRRSVGRKRIGNSMKVLPNNPMFKIGRP